MDKKAIFLDRDGVINEEVSYLYKIENFKFIDGIFEACQYFNSQGYEIIILTNQSGISRGFYTVRDYDKLMNWMLSKFSENSIRVLDTFYCPHIPESKCNCRKPKPGMFLNAMQKHKINMKNSWMIGDKETDIEAANSAGIKNTILVRSGHLIDEYNSKSLFIIDSIKESMKIII